MERKNCVTDVNSRLTAVVSFLSTSLTTGERPTQKKIKKTKTHKRRGLNSEKKIARFYRRQNFGIVVEFFFGRFHATETVDQHLEGLVQRHEHRERTCRPTNKT